MHEPLAHVVSYHDPGIGRLSVMEANAREEGPFVVASGPFPNVAEDADPFLEAMGYTFEDVRSEIIARVAYRTANRRGAFTGLVVARRTMTDAEAGNIDGELMPLRIPSGFVRVDGCPTSGFNTAWICDGETISAPQGLADVRACLTRDYVHFHSVRIDFADGNIFLAQEPGDWLFTLDTPAGVALARAAAELNFGFRETHGSLNDLRSGYEDFALELRARRFGKGRADTSADDC